MYVNPSLQPAYQGVQVTHSGMVRMYKVNSIHKQFSVFEPCKKGLRSMTWSLDTVRSVIVKFMHIAFMNAIIASTSLASLSLVLVLPGSQTSG